MNRESTVNININEHGYESNKIPKNIIVSDQELNPVKSDWIIDRNTVSYNLEPGIYVAELFLSSNQRFSQTFELFEGETCKVNFNIADLSPHETHEWAYFTKNISPKPITDGAIVATGLVTTLWTKNDNVWTSKPGPVADENLYADGKDFVLQLDRNLHVLEVSVDKQSPIFVSLPPSENLRCLIKRNTKLNDSEHPLEVFVSTDKWVAETILSYLVRGSTAEASSLATYSHYAEELLYSKSEDPASAAIGGYYLLKTFDLERMHQWPRNLSNWFQWMPDGAVIRAWQLLIDGKRSGQINRNEIENLLIDAFTRGLPIYSEGLRLLHEGLRILYFNPGEDEIKNELVKDMFNDVSSVCSRVDWKKGPTTFTAPLLNSKEPLPAFAGPTKPADLDEMSSIRLRGGKVKFTGSWKQVEEKSTAQQGRKTEKLNA